MYGVGTFTMPPSAKKAYCFTLNNYSEDEYENIKRVLGSECTYGVVGREIGSNGTPHLQGYAIFQRAYRFNTIKDRFFPRCHVEEARSDASTNRKYCTKDGSFDEYGVIPDFKGGRDLLAKKFVKYMEPGGPGLIGFADEHPSTYYFSGHNLLRNYFAVQPAISRPDISVKWIWGPPGVGKSREAHEVMPNAYIKDPRTKWWNGYMFEKEVIIDDFGPGGIDINHLLRWFDRYKCYVETKGGMMPLCAETFIITSNFHPNELYRSINIRYEGNSTTENISTHPQLPALLRRISLIEM